MRLLFICSKHSLQTFVLSFCTCVCLSNRKIILTKVIDDDSIPISFGRILCCGKKFCVELICLHFLYSGSCFCTWLILNVMRDWIINPIIELAAAKVSVVKHKIHLSITFTGMSVSYLLRLSQNTKSFLQHAV